MRTIIIAIIAGLAGFTLSRALPARPFATWVSVPALPEITWPANSSPLTAPVAVSATSAPEPTVVAPAAVAVAASAPVAAPVVVETPQPIVAPIVNAAVAAAEPPPSPGPAHSVAAVIEATPITIDSPAEGVVLTQATTPVEAVPVTERQPLLARVTAAALPVAAPESGERIAKLVLPQLAPAAATATSESTPRAADSLARASRSIGQLSKKLRGPFR